jgi:group I intron endonuclease
MCANGETLAVKDGRQSRVMEVTMIIYKILNRKTGSVYIGKTNNLERRKREHISIAYNPNSSEYLKLLYRKIRQYGVEEFEFYIIEECEDSIWKDREKYWISYHNSFHGIGYNESEGGDGVPIGNSIEPFISNIILDLKENKMTQETIAFKYNTVSSVISNINNGLILKQLEIDYPIRQNFLSEEVLDNLKDLLENTTLSFKEISNQLGIGESTVKKINYGQIQHTKHFTSFPVRKLSGVKQKANIVKELLRETNYTFNEISKLSGTSYRTVSRINCGETHKEDNVVYPIRRTSAM